MPKGFSVIYLLIGVVILTIVGGGVYYLSKSQTPAAQPEKPIVTSQTSQATPVLTSTQLTNEITNWKLKSIRLLSFKYPSDWEESQDKTTGGITIIKPIDQDTVWVGVNDYIYTNQSETPEQLAKQALGDEIPINKKQIIVDGHNAIYQERRYPSSVRIEVYIGNVKEVSESLAQDDSSRLSEGTLSLFMEIKDLNQLETNRTIFNQIITTFKFK